VLQLQKNGISITSGGRGVAHLVVAEDSYNTTDVNATKITKLKDLRMFKLQIERSKESQVIQNLDNTIAYF
jgi:hypothetical protein